MRAAEGGPLHLPVLIAVTTGVRRGELLGLRWSDIDLKAARLTVNQSLERLGGKTTFKSPKTPGSRRTITLPALTVEAFRAARGPGELVFSHEGIPWDPDSLTKAFDRLIAATGVRRITFHGLRHTHISHQLMDGVHVKVVSERAGHASVSTTLSVYAAFIPTLQADAAAGVDAWLRQSLADQVGGKSVAIRHSEPGAGHLTHWNPGGPERSRTSDLRFRKPLLYPAELRDRYINQ